MGAVFVLFPMAAPYGYQPGIIFQIIRVFRPLIRVLGLVLKRPSDVDGIRNLGLDAS